VQRNLASVLYFDYSRNMETIDAVAALGALAQETRLAIFRLLVRQGPSGLPAGGVAESLGVQPSTLSFHLAHLERAGLLHSWRVQRQIFYAVDFAGMRELLGFLTDDCCQGHPDICTGLAAAPAATACRPARTGEVR
jgi:ArsR family transcriptional regulator, arsenate/arsenite/antimonite-responsive transcriptional repressor